MPAGQNAEANSYRLNTRTVYLTYAQCPLEMPTLLEKLRTIKDYVHYAVCREQHEDGNYHLHCMLQFTTPVNTRNSRYFDIEGYHPNVQSARRPKDVLAYIRKDGEYLDNWPTRRSYGDIITEAKDFDNFMELVKTNQPKDFILHHDKLEYYADKYFKRPPSPYQNIPNSDPWQLPDDIANWLSTEFTKIGI